MDNAARPRSYAQALECLRRVGIRPTRQRLALAKLLFEQGDRHITAEQLHEEAQGTGVRISLASVYNSLHQFTEVGLLREGVVEPRHRYFDTNTTYHHHFYFEDDGRLMDIAGDRVEVARLPTPPAGTTLRRVDVILRVVGHGNLNDSKLLTNTRHPGQIFEEISDRGRRKDDK
jgi:Fur family iron response transcriptional regulator